MKTKRSAILLFLLPASIFYVGFFLVPSIWAFYYSLFDWSGFSSEMKFVGFDNFSRIFTDQIFWKSFGNTMKILIVGSIATFVLSFLLASMMNSGIKGKSFFRAVIFLPNVVATIAVTTIWAFVVYNPRSGVLPKFFDAIGWEGAANYLWNSPDHVFWSMLIAVVWVSVGYYVILLLAGMDRIPKEYYEVADLEGASGLAKFFKITLPLMWDVVIVSVVLWSISAIKVFEFPFAYMGAGEDPNLYTVGVYLYVMGFGKRQPIYQLGYATAIGVVMVVFVILVSILVRRLMKRENYQF